MRYGEIVKRFTVLQGDGDWTRHLARLLAGDMTARQGGKYIESGTKDLRRETRVCGSVNIWSHGEACTETVLKFFECGFCTVQIVSGTHGGVPLKQHTENDLVFLSEKSYDMKLVVTHLGLFSGDGDISNL